MTSPQDPHTQVYSHINGPVADLLDRLAVSEICKGWPIYRDASEWQNFRSLFAPKATVWTTWSGACDVDKFIEVSKRGKQNGVFIQHRECGTLVELGAPLAEGESRDAGSAESAESAENTPATVRRAVGKMKATITQRFTDASDGSEFDVDCDCRFIFFCEKVAGSGAAAPADKWQTVYVKLVYEKDKIVTVDGHAAPRITAAERKYMAERLPEGYRYLGIMQRRLGYAIDLNLATPRNAGWERMYLAMEQWLAGRKVTLGWGGRAGEGEEGEEEAEMGEGDAAK